jgi:hypothetical protein
VLEKLHGNPGNTTVMEVTGPKAGPKIAAWRKFQVPVPSRKIGSAGSEQNVKVVKHVINIAVFLLTG